MPSTRHNLDYLVELVSKFTEYQLTKILKSYNIYSVIKGMNNGKRKMLIYITISEATLQRATSHTANLLDIPQCTTVGRVRLA